MSGILRLESLTKGNTLKQGDKTPLKYRLFDADGEKLNIAGKTAVARLMYPDFLRVGYESEELTVSTDNTVTFSIDKVIQPILYYLEITVDDKYIFPSRDDESKLNIDKSSKGSDVAIIEIIGKDVLVRDIKNMVDSEIEPVVNDMIISNQKVIENEKIVKDVQTLSEQLETRQNQVEQFNNQVITEMTDKDVISAPEIIDARGTKETLNGRISEIASQTYDVFNVSAGGADGSERDVTGIIQAALDENDSVYIPNGEHYISDTITIPYGKELIFAKRAILKLTNVNKNAIQLKNKAKLINPTIFLPQGHTGAGIYISAADGIALDTIIENVYIDGGGSESTGIYYEAVTPGSYIYYTTIRRAYIKTCGKGIHFKKDNNATGYINSNIVSDITTYQCASHIHIEGNVQANQFENFRMQWSNSVVPSVYGVYCEGIHNTFNGRAWDFKYGSLAYYFSESSIGNVVLYSGYLYESVFKDFGRGNNIMQPLSDTLDNTIISPNVHQQGEVLQGRRFEVPFTYAGNQDDILSYADRRFTIRNLGKSILTGSLKNVFDPYTNQSEGVYYTNPTEEDPIIIEIDTGDSRLLNVPFIGISFSTMAIAEDFSVEISRTSAGEYGEPIYVKGNNKSHYNVFFNGGDITTIISKLRIKITKAKFNETVNTNKTVIIKRIFSVSMQEAGHAYLPRGGGVLYGDIRFNSNTGIVLESPDGSKYKILVDDNGTIKTIKV